MLAEGRDRAHHRLHAFKADGRDERTDRPDRRRDLPPCMAAASWRMVDELFNRVEYGRWRSAPPRAVS